MSTTTDVPASITTPDTVQTQARDARVQATARRRRTTAERLYDNLDFMRGVEAFLNSIQGASLTRSDAAS